MSAVAKRYASALFAVAKERGSIDKIETELKDVVRVIQQTPELGKVLVNPKITVDDKKSLLTEVFQSHVGTETMNLLCVLLENGRESDLPAIADAYVRLANEERGIADAIVTTATALSEAEEGQIAEKFGKLINKKLRIQTVVDPSILGGVIVKIGDRLYDGSIKSKLEHFAHQL